MRKQLPGLLLVLSLIVAVCNESKVKADLGKSPDEAKQAAEEPKASGRGVASAAEAKDEKARPELVTANTIAVFTSCDVGQTTFEDAALGHGVFIHFLLEGLQGNAVDDHGELTLLDLFEYTGDHTMKYVAKRFGALQRPRIMGCVASSTRLLPPRKSPDSRGPQLGYRALLIGVDKYAVLDDARFPVADAEALAETLIKSGYPEQQVSLVCDTAADRDHLPSRANILRQLEAIANAAAPGDLVIVAYSGQGWRTKGKSYLCPTEANPADPTGSMIALDEIVGALEKSKACTKLVIFHTCLVDSTAGAR